MSFPALIATVQLTVNLEEKKESVNPQGSFSPGSAWYKLDALI